MNSKLDSDIKPDELSLKWCISLKTAEIIMVATNHKYIRTAGLLTK